MESGQGVACLPDGPAVIVGDWLGRAGNFIASVSHDGSWQSVVEMPAMSTTLAGVDALCDGTLVVTGNFSDVITLWGGTAYEATLTPAGGSDLLLFRVPCDLFSH